MIAAGPVLLLHVHSYLIIQFAFVIVALLFMVLMATIVFVPLIMIVPEYTFPNAPFDKQ